MTNCTAAAPARATRAPARSKAAPAPAITSTPSERAVSAASRAASEALSYVSILLCEIVENDDFIRHFGASADLFRAADKHAANLAYGDEDDQPVEVGSAEIKALAAVIDMALESLDTAAQDSPLAAPMVVATLAQHAQELLVRIADALEASPATLAPLDALRTYAGRRPHRKQPQPPVRRMDDAPAPGYTPAQLRMVLEFVAGTTATMNRLLMMAQTCDEQWECARLVDAAQSLAQHIGGVADDAVGGSIIGNHKQWCFGLGFEKLGKAGAA